MLPSLYEGLRSTQRQRTDIFIAFTGEERGELGSATYVREMTKEQLAQSKAMVNLDTLGLGPNEGLAEPLRQEADLVVKWAGECDEVAAGSGERGKGWALLDDTLGKESN